MSARKTLAEAWRTLRRNRMRTFLMMIGIVIGISSLTILNSVGEGTRRETMRRFKNMIGTFDTIIVRPGASRMRGMPTLANVPPTPSSSLVVTRSPKAGRSFQLMTRNVSLPI